MASDPLGFKLRNINMEFTPIITAAQVEKFQKELKDYIEGSGCKLVLEDEIFERYYKVYGEDQVSTRYVLTPAMMQALDVPPCVYSPLCNSTDIFRRINSTIFKDTRVQIKRAHGHNRP